MNRPNLMAVSVPALIEVPTNATTPAYLTTFTVIYLLFVSSDDEIKNCPARYAIVMFRMSIVEKNKTVSNNFERGEKLFQIRHKKQSVQEGWFVSATHPTRAFKI